MAGWALISNLFSCRDVLKVGVAFEGDLRKLAADYPHGGCGSAGLAPFCDAQALFSEGVQPESLVKIVARRLGVVLSKQQQMSDWERRPLSQEQLEYAAIDAWVLLSLFCTLSAQELGSLTPCSLGCETGSVSPADTSAPPSGQHPQLEQQQEPLPTRGEERASAQSGARVEQSAPINHPHTLPPTARQCAECGIKTAVGDVDVGNGLFYCEQCFRRFDYLEAVAQMLRDRGLGSMALKGRV